MHSKRFIVEASIGCLLAVAATVCAAPPPSHTVTIPHDSSWIPARSVSAAGASVDFSHDTDAVSQFHFKPDRPRVQDTPPPVDPAAVGRIPEESGNDALAPQGCLSNPQQQKCH